MRSPHDATQPWSPCCCPGVVRGSPGGLVAAALEGTRDIHRHAAPPRAPARRDCMRSGLRGAACPEGSGGGEGMAPVMAWSARALVGTGRPGDATPSRRTTTLYDLIATLQEVAEADDARVVGTLVHLLRSGRLTRCGPTQAVGPIAAGGEGTKEAGA